jgi:hypothetical protein
MDLPRFNPPVFSGQMIDLLSSLKKNININSLALCEKTVGEGCQNEQSFNKSPKATAELLSMMERR